MSAISEAVILMAGTGSRLRGAREGILKPLVPVLGRPLISYTIDALSSRGIEQITAVVGFQSASLVAGLKPLIPSHVQLRLVDNVHWQKQNGISLLAAKKSVSGPFLLTMSDHLFDPVIVDLLINSAQLDRVNLAIDRKLDTIFDIDDAMKVQTKGDQIVAIAKDLTNYDAVDTGLFICPREIFSYLERAREEDDCSLADAVRLMAADGKVRAIDIGQAWWQDIDNPEMLRHAETMIAQASTK
jgi:1L-myo-inositol 1-phosphate cytidylyltransferase